MSARGKKLAEFDEGRAKFLQRLAQALRGGKPGQLLLRFALRAERKVPRTGQRQAPRQRLVAIFQKDADDDTQPLDVLNRFANFSKSSKIFCQRFEDSRYLRDCQQQPQVARLVKIPIIPINALLSVLIVIKLDI